MDCGTFPDGHVIPDDGFRIFAFVFQVLGDLTDAGTLEELAVFPMVVRPVITTWG